MAKAMRAAGWPTSWRPSFEQVGGVEAGSVAAIHSSLACRCTVRSSGFFHGAYRACFSARACPLAVRRPRLSLSQLPA